MGRLQQQTLTSRGAGKVRVEVPADSVPEMALGLAGSLLAVSSRAERHHLFLSGTHPIMQAPP